MKNNNNHVIVNECTPIKTNYYAESNSVTIDKIFRLKTFASHKILKYKNKLTMRLYNANSTTKTFWYSILNPVFAFFHSIGIYIAQGFIYVFILPFYRIKIAWNDWKIKK